MSVLEDVTLLGDSAIGAIGPDDRIKHGEISADKVDELAHRLETDEFYDEVSDELGPNSAGGTFSLVIADALTNSRFRLNGESAKEHARVVYTWLLENKNDAESRKVIPRVCVDGRIPVNGSVDNESVVGTHQDENGPGGCGAENKLNEILLYISNRGEQLRQIAAILGVEVDASTSQLISENARTLLEDGYVNSGSELREVCAEVAGESSVVTLAGTHKEVVAAVNTDKSKTLNRAKVREIFGEGYDVFDVDAGVFQEAAAVISDGSADDINQKFTALLYYNLGTTVVLSDKSLRLAQHGAL